jgi:hypothetical protein
MFRRWNRECPGRAAVISSNRGGKEEKRNNLEKRASKDKKS